MGIYLIPHMVQEGATPAPASALQASAQTPYQPEIKGEACLRIHTTEDRIRPVRTSDDTAMWIYQVVVRNTGELPFTVERVEQQAVSDNGKQYALGTFFAADLSWGDGVILPGCEQSFRGGFPVQPMNHILVTVHGTDANSKVLSFDGEVNLTKETAE